jgi:hypothetical protein
MQLPIYLSFSKKKKNLNKKKKIKKFELKKTFSVELSCSFDGGVPLTFESITVVSLKLFS